MKFIIFKRLNGSGQPELVENFSAEGGIEQAAARLNLTPGRVADCVSINRIPFRKESAGKGDYYLHYIKVVE